jgi:vacuolar-type H+-ATPase subunit I/STV1
MNTEQKPGLVTAIAVMTLISGIINLFWGFVASATVLSWIVGVVCLPLTILPTILGIFEIIYAAKLLSTQPEPVQPSTPLAVFQILTIFYGNIFSVVVGILLLIFFNDVAVRNYFIRLNTTGTPAPQPQTDSTPVVIEEPSVPETPETPKKPKTIRKVAGK